MMTPAFKSPRRSKSRTTKKRKRRNDPDQTRVDILTSAETEFARYGYDGTTIDSIAAKTKRSKRMIYYYFATKAKLYVAVLEAAYRRNRIAEGKVDLDHPDPRQCLKNLVA